MEVNGLIQVRQDTLLLKSVLETEGKAVERAGLSKMTSGTECKCSSMKVDGLIQVRYDALLLKFIMETSSKVAETGGSSRVTRGMEYKCISI